MPRTSRAWVTGVRMGAASEAVERRTTLEREHAEARLAAAVAARGFVVDDSHAPAAWILADRSGNKVCIAAWPDGAEDPAG